MQNHTLPSVQQIRSFCSPETLRMGISKHAALHCHRILRTGCVLKTPDCETYQSHQSADGRGKGRSRNRMACFLPTKI